MSAVQGSSSPHSQFFREIDQFDADPKNSKWKNLDEVHLDILEYVSSHHLTDSDIEVLRRKFVKINYGFLCSNSKLYRKAIDVLYRGPDLTSSLKPAFKYGHIFRFVEILSDAFDQGQNVDQVLDELCKDCPGCTFLEKTRANPQWLIDLYYPPFTEKHDEKPRLLDLRGFFGYPQAQEVLKRNAMFTNQHITLDLGQRDIISLIKNDLKNCTSLDLRDCKSLDWFQIADPLKLLNHLNNLILPPSILNLTCYANPYSFTSSTVRFSIQTAIRVDHEDKSLLQVSGVQVGLEIVAKIAKGAKNKIRIPNDGICIFNAMVQTNKSSDQVIFEESLNLSGLEIVDENLLRNFNFGKVKHIALQQCPNITPGALRVLYESHNFESIALNGCDQIGDEYFENHPLLTQKGKFSSHSLGLNATSVSLAIVQKIKDAQPGITIYYDENYLTYRTKAYLKARTSAESSTLSQEALKALYGYEITGHLPQISIGVAMEILINQGRILSSKTKKAQIVNYCLHMIFNNLSQGNVLSIYQFAKKHSLVELKAHVKAFMHIFCHPHIPEYWNKLNAEQQKLALLYFGDFEFQRLNHFKAAQMYDETAPDQKVNIPSTDIFGDDDL